MTSETSRKPTCEPFKNVASLLMILFGVMVSSPGRTIFGAQETENYLTKDQHPPEILSISWVLIAVSLDLLNNATLRVLPALLKFGHKTGEITEIQNEENLSNELDLENGVGEDEIPFEEIDFTKVQSDFVPDAPEGVDPYQDYDVEKGEKKKIHPGLINELIEILRKLRQALRKFLSYLFMLMSLKIVWIGPLFFSTLASYLGGVKLFEFVLKILNHGLQKTLHTQIPLNNIIVLILKSFTAILIAGSNLENFLRLQIDSIVENAKKLSEDILKDLDLTRSTVGLTLLFVIPNLVGSMFFDRMSADRGLSLVMHQVSQLTGEGILPYARIPIITLSIISALWGFASRSISLIPSTYKMVQNTQNYFCGTNDANKSPANQTQDNCCRRTTLFTIMALSLLTTVSANFIGNLPTFVATATGLSAFAGVDDRNLYVIAAAFLIFISSFISNTAFHHDRKTQYFNLANNQLKGYNPLTFKSHKTLPNVVVNDTLDESLSDDKAVEQRLIKFV